MMLIGDDKTWRQRVSLARYALQAASRTRDFTFFKTIQASLHTRWAENASLLRAVLPDDSQILVRALNDLSISMVIVHQDSYKAIYDDIRASASDADSISRRARLLVDICQKRQAVEFGIVKAFNAVLTLIDSQPIEAQGLLTEAFVYGLSLVADAIQECQLQTDKLEISMDDFLSLEYGWQSVQSGVTASTAILRDVLELSIPKPSPDFDTISLHSEHTSVSETRSRRPSTASTTSSIFKRISGALYPAQAVAEPHAEAILTPPSSTRTSVSFTSLTELRNTIEDAYPTKLHARSKRFSHDPDRFSKQLSAIPASPFVGREAVDPFDLIFSV